MAAQCSCRSFVHKSRVTASIQATNITGKGKYVKNYIKTTQRLKNTRDQKRKKIENSFSDVFYDLLSFFHEKMYYIVT